jgi:hypothetical protein
MNKKGHWATWVLGIIFVYFALVVLVPTTRDFLLPWTEYKAEVTSAEQVIARTYNADNAIYNYEWFKKQEQDIKATEQQIQNTISERDNFRVVYGDASTWDWSTKEEYARLSTTLTGQKNYYADLVADYNARSNMANREIFKDGLPRQIDKRIW